MNHRREHHGGGFGKPIENDRPPAVSPSSSAYKALWDRHFWSGLISAPILIIAALTGALLVFQEELEPMVTSARITVEGEPQEASTLLNQARALEPGVHFTRLSLPFEEDRVWQLEGERNGETVSFLWNPYQGRISEVRHGGHFFDFVTRVHRNLAGGTVGRLLVEIATCWGLISLLSGLYLWWPRGKNKYAGVWYPRNHGGKRRVLKDWHTVLGFYSAVASAAILFTGLLFTLVWGTLVFALASTTGTLPKTFTDPAKVEPAPGQEPADLQLVLNTIADFRDLKGVIVRFPKKPSQAYRVDFENDRALSDSARILINPYTAEMMQAETWSDLSPLSKTLLSFYPIHSGGIFGLPTKIIAVLSCLAIVFLSFSGILMWWWRSKKGNRFQGKNSLAYPKWLTRLHILCLILLPAAGLTYLLWWTGSKIYRTIKKRI